MTPDEFRAEVWHAVIHGARGVIYFPQRLGRNPAKDFRYDATPPKVALEMVLQNRRLTELQEMLVSEMNPAGFKVSADKPMEIGWRVRGGKLDVIALNFSDAEVKEAAISFQGKVKPAAGALWESRSIQVTGGVIRDSFGPYGVRVYELTLE